MASRATKRRHSRRNNAAQTSAQQADDLEILHPERELTIKGRKLCVREYGFIEGLRLRPLLQPFLDDLHSIALNEDRVPDLSEVTVLLGVYADLVVQAVAKAADVEPDWINGLSQDEGELLLMAWWGANGPFFVRTVVRRILIKKQAQAEAERAGQMSMPSSVPQATGMQPLLAH